MDINGFWARDGHACTRTRTRVHAPLTVADRLIRLDMPRWLYIQAVLPRYQRLAAILAPSTPFVNNVWAIACAREDARSILLGNWPVTRWTERVVRIDLVVFTLRGHRGLLMLVLDESAQRLGDRVLVMAVRDCRWNSNVNDKYCWMDVYQRWV